MAKLINPNELFDDAGLNKFQKKQIEVAEAAIKSFDKHSIEGTHFGHVAEELGVTRPLIKHYFESKEDLADFVIKYIRLQYQESVLQRVEAATSAEEKFNVYLDEVLQWPQKKKMHARVWCNFLQICSRDKDQMAVHDTYIQGTQDRIASLITTINKKSKDQNMKTAKLIEVLLSGTLITLLTESLPEKDQVLKDIHTLIWQLVRS